MSANPIRFLHPFLMAIFPLIALYAYNRGEFPLSVIAEPLGVVIAATAIVFLGAWYLSGQSIASPIIVSTLLLLFFAQGHMYKLMYVILPYYNLRDPFIPTLVFFALILMCVGILLLRLSDQRIYELHTFFGILGFALLVYPSLQTIVSVDAVQSSVAPAVAGASIPVAPDRAPDVYHIVLDGHARSDVLEEVFGVSNRAFIEDLRKRGFFVADEATSNYAQTYLTMASVFDMQLILDHPNAPEPTVKKSPLPWSMLRENKVITMFREHGYQFVALPSAWQEYSSLPAPDIQVKAPTRYVEYENILLQTTPLEFLVRDLQFDWFRENIQHAFELTPTVAMFPQPTYAYTHITAPHPPFVFDRDGNPVQRAQIYTTMDFSWRNEGNSEREYIEGYREQVVHTDRLALRMIDQILEQSATPPVIILHSDHGPAARLDSEYPSEDGIRDRMSILYAMYLPSQNYEVLSPDFTPVNIFGVVFEEIFGIPFEPTPPKNYYSSGSRPYDFLNVTPLLSGSST